MDRESLADTRFVCTPRERAVFEAGIKMGTIYHQFVGTPISNSNVSDLETAIQRSIEVQPYVVSAKVSIDRAHIPSGDGVYDYTSLTGDMIDAVVDIEIDGIKVRSEMRYDAELRYPLMYISGIDG